MKKIFTVLMLSILVAVMNRALSFLGLVNLVWILGFALFLAWRGGAGILFIVLSGLLNDLLNHEELGFTSLPILLALVIIVILESLVPRFDISSIGENIFSLLVGLFIGYILSNSIMMVFLHDSHLGSLNISNWIYPFLINAVISVFVFLFLSKYKSKTEGLNKVKI